MLLAAVGLALAVGAWRLVADGRFRGAPAGAGSTGASASGGYGTAGPAVDVVRRAGGELGERATLLQFSSAFCAPCRATRRVLADVAGRLDGVTHVEVDAEEHLGATRELAVLRTPTTIVLDGAGREVSRATGAPTSAQVLAAVGRAGP